MTHRVWNRTADGKVTGLIRVAILIVAGWLTVQHATAQGIPLIPDPIATPELMRYADRLDLSPQQRLALLPLHDRYLQRYGKLREHGAHA